MEGTIEENLQGKGEEMQNKQFLLKEATLFPLQSHWNLVTWMHPTAKEAGKCSLKLGGLCLLKQGGWQEEA